VRSERNKIRSDSEKQEIMFEIKSQDSKQTIEVVLHGFLEAFLGVRAQPESFVAATRDTSVYARIANSHLSGVHLLFLGVLDPKHRLTLGKRHL
jgi:hypothetical protein